MLKLLIQEMKEIQKYFKKRIEKNVIYKLKCPNLKKVFIS